jgi:hypothetical protein
MQKAMERRTVYAITLVAILALAGSWAFAATVVTANPPPQSSTVTVVTPNGAPEIVQSSQMITASAWTAGLGAAGTQPGTGNGLNSTFGTNVRLASCPVASCSGNFSAVDATFGLVNSQTALQVVVLALQGATAVGFDVQVEVIYSPSTAPLTTVYAFGSGYFDTQTSADTSSTISVFLFVGLGTPSITPPSITNVVITVNSCTSATTCP